MPRVQKWGVTAEVHAKAQVANLRQQLTEASKSTSRRWLVGCFYQGPVGKHSQFVSDAIDEKLEDSHDLNAIAPKPYTDCCHLAGCSIGRGGCVSTLSTFNQPLSGCCCNVNDARRPRTRAALQGKQGLERIRTVYRRKGGRLSYRNERAMISRIRRHAETFSSQCTWVTRYNARQERSRRKMTLPMIAALGMPFFLATTSSTGSPVSAALFCAPAENPIAFSLRHHRCSPRKGFLDDIRNPKLLRSHCDGAGIITG